jgi:hypothetical protein
MRFGLAGIILPAHPALELHEKLKPKPQVATCGFFVTTSGPSLH